MKYTVEFDSALEMQDCMDWVHSHRRRRLKEPFLGSDGRKLIAHYIYDTRVLKCCESQGVVFIDEVEKLSDLQLLRWDNFSKISLKKLRNAIEYSKTTCNPL